MNATKTQTAESQDRRQAALKASVTRKHRAAAKKAALTRKRRAAARKAAATRRRGSEAAENGMQAITTTIKREWLREIVAGRKRIECRAIKPYWELRFAKVRTPFLLRLINGMSAKAPEVTVEIDKIVRNTRHKEFELHIAKVVHMKNWSRAKEQPL